MRQASFIVFAFFSALLFPLSAWAGTEELIYGISERQFPAVSSWDYSLARANAWLKAVRMGAKFLPPAAVLRIRKNDFQPGLASLACSALFFPLDVVTPEKAAGKQLRVFLKFPSAPQARVDNIFRDSELLLLEMSLLKETEDTVSEIEKIQHAKPSDKAAALQLDALAKRLDALWTARDLLELDAFGGNPEWLPAFSAVADPLTVRIAIARETEDLSLLENLTRELLGREAETKDPLWTRIASLSLFHRGLAHQKLSQPGLAEADFTAALARMRKSNTDEKQAIRIYLARGALRRQQNNPGAMCEDFAAACALGECHNLSSARLDGLCLESRP